MSRFVKQGLEDLIRLVKKVWTQSHFVSFLRSRRAPHCAREVTEHNSAVLARLAGVLGIDQHDRWRDFRMKLPEEVPNPFKAVRCT
jgi:hypothetical protein